MTGLYLGQAIGGFGATLALAYSWNQTFHWFGIIGVSYSVVLAFFLKDKDRTADNVKPEIAPMKKISVLKILAMLFSNTFLN